MMLMRKFRAYYPVREGYWFAPKLFGLGAMPATWQGWLATSAYLMLIGLLVGVMPTDRARVYAVLPVTIGFLWLVWRKTDGGWRWRRGRDDR